MVVARAFAILAFAFTWSPFAARAEPEALPDVQFGYGASAVAGGIRVAANVHPLGELGPDAEAFRFTSDPASGLDKGYVFEGRRRRNEATLEVSWLDRPGARYGDLRWTRTRRATFHISLDAYAELASLVDEQMTRDRAFNERQRQGEVPAWICNDGSVLLVERVHEGRESWMSGDCGPNHPDAIIDRRLRAFTLDLLGN